MANNAPVVLIGNQSLLHDQWQRLQPWITYTDADGNPAVRYQFWDSGMSATSVFLDSNQCALGCQHHH